ncbi:hypothetical protein GCM10020255_004660 [Rhodococcus baikonurensis]
MTALFAVAVVALRDRALITDAPAVSPHTLDHLPGRAIRGMLASVCTPTELDLLIAEESVLWAGTACRAHTRAGFFPAWTSTRLPCRPHHRQRRPGQGFL